MGRDPALANQIALSTASREGSFRLLETSRSPSAKSTPTNIFLNRFMEFSFRSGHGRIDRRSIGPFGLCLLDCLAHFVRLLIHGWQEVHSLHQPIRKLFGPKSVKHSSPFAAFSDNSMCSQDHEVL